VYSEEITDYLESKDYHLTHQEWFKVVRESVQIVGAKEIGWGDFGTRIHSWTWDNHNWDIILKN
jgi:hypothetical protein